MRSEYVRRAWWQILVVFLGIVALSPVVLLMPGWCQQFAFGVILSPAVWAALYLIATLSGSASPLLGQLGEQWTAGELRRQGRRGWHLANRVLLRPASDIDHVLIGPGGALVVESKYRSEGWASSRATDEVVARAVQQAEENVHDIWLFLKPAIPRELVRPVVVLWGRASESISIRSVRGVTLVPGSQFRRWLGDLASDGIDQVSVEAAWSKVVGHLARRDKADLARIGPPPRSWGEWIQIGFLTGAVGLSGLLADNEILRATGTVWFIPVGAAVGSVAWLGHRLGLHRRWTIAWAVGTQSLTVLFAVAYLASWILRVTR
jgi:hypothetical protein